MGKLWKLVMANIRKDRGQLAIFFMILTLAGLLLHTALIVSDYGNVYDKRTEERGVADAAFFGYFDEERFTEALSSYPEVRSFWKEEIITPDTMTAHVEGREKGKELDSLVVISDQSENYAGTLHFLRRDETLEGNRICLNLYLARMMKVCIGDRLTLESEVFGSQDYVVAGIYEDLLFGSGLSYCSVMIDEDCYRNMVQVCDRIAEAKGIYAKLDCYSVFYENGKTLPNAELEKLGSYALGGRPVWDVRPSFKASYVSIVNILAAFMGAFAVIIILVTVTTVAFTIGNNVEKDIRNLGALRAVGFTTGDLCRAIMAEFALITLIAVSTGIAISYFVYPWLETAYIQEQTGMKWDGQFQASYSLFLLLCVLLLIALITLIATARIRKLSPAMALRFGLASNSFRKNYLPLAESKGGLNFLLAMKTCLQSKGQNMTVFLSMILVSFVATFAAMLFYNTQIDVSKFQHLVQGDVPDAFVHIKGQSLEEARRIREELLKVEGISQVYGLSNTSGHVGDEYATILYSNSNKDVYCGLYKGTMALEDNEAVVAGGLAEKLELDVGDEVRVSVGEQEETFLITGLQQAVYGMGTRIYLTEGGVARLGVEPNYQSYRIRLYKPTADAVDTVLERAKKELGDRCNEVENYYRFQRSMDNVPVMAVSFIVLLLVVLLIAIAVLVLSLIIRNVFVKKEKEFGIKKAIGFTAYQLRIQLALSLSIIVTIASVLGGACGYFLTNPLITLIFTGYGIRSADLYVCASVAVCAAGLVILLSALISFAAARRMKKVSAYHLIRD